MSGHPKIERTAKTTGFWAGIALVLWVTGLGADLASLLDAGIHALEAMESCAPNENAAR